MRSHAVWGLLILIASNASFAFVPSVTLPARRILRDPVITMAPTRDSQFAAIGHLTSSQSCASTQPPQALATPDPLLEVSGLTSKITVSFIVGTDGRVHSPLILEGSGAPEDRAVLEAVSSWRYRPATCNGVPTESEGKIAFSSR